MKKPEITSGPWGLKLGSHPLANTGDFIPYAEILGGENQVIGQCFETMQINVEEQQANAQAMSAVPEMLDALIEVRLLMDRPKQKVTLKEKEDLRDEIDAALKKVGVEL